MRRNHITATVEQAKASSGKAARARNQADLDAIDREIA
jgi:hypothetical protein